jgi:hypothetical protein
LLIVKHTNKKMEIRYEHDFNDAGFIASLCRGFTRDPSSGNSEALLDGVPDLAV